MGQRLYKRATSPNWYTTIDGKPRSTGCRDRRAAETRSATWEREAAAPAPPPRPAGHATTLGQALAHAMTDRVERGRAAGTLHMWGIKAGQLLRALGDDLLLADLDAKAVDAFASQRLAEGASRSTIGKELGVLRVTLKLARRRGDFGCDPAAVLPVGWGDAYVPRGRSLSPEEARVLVADLLDDDLPMLRRKAGPPRGDHSKRPPTGPTSTYERTRQRSMVNRAGMVAFIIATSARWGEAVRARREDVVLVEGGGFVRLRGTKTAGAARVVPILPTTAALVRMALEHGREVGELFEPWGNVGRDLASACRRLGIPTVTPNDLRRTTAQWLRSAGVEPHLIAAVLGHADARMVERVYGKITPEALGEALRARVGGVVPLLPVGKRAAKAGKKRTG